MSVINTERPFINGALREFTVHPDRVRAHLMLIASASQSDFDPSFGDEPYDQDGDGVNEGSRVIYNPTIADPNTDAGRVKTNLKALVDRPSQTTIFGVDWTWIVSTGGDTTSATPGLQLGSTIVYDTSQANGQGRWYWTGDGKKCLLDADILYHELMHVLRNHGGLDSSPAADEREARVLEGDFQRALGRHARDPDRPEAGVGCEGEGPCCIVATVAAGSSEAPAVSRLRGVRDHALRATPFGQAWFAELHHEYYAFSVPVARSMVRDRAVMDTIADWIVAPLIDALELAVMWGAGEDVLGQQVAARCAIVPDGAWPMLDDLLESLVAGSTAGITALPLEPAMLAAVEPLAKWIPNSPHVRWAIVDLLRRFGRTSVLAAGGATATSLSRAWARQMEEWIANMPVDAAAASAGATTTEERERAVRGFTDSVLHGPSANRAAHALLQRLSASEERETDAG